MKPVNFFTFFFVLMQLGAQAQVTNIRSGLWSDNTVWSSNAVPTAGDDVLLQFDISISGNAYCHSLNANGHNVTINSGGNLFVTGASSSGDTLMSRFVVIDTTGPVVDTFETNDFFYDSQKRNTVAVTQQYESGLTYKTVSKFSYEGNSRVPFYEFTYSYHYFNGDSSYNDYESWYRYEGERLVVDSGNGGSVHYTYLPNAVVKQVNYSTGDTLTDTIFVQYDVNGNITLQTYSSRPDSFVYVYDGHPNPFYYVNRNKGRVVYQVETFLQEVIARNNMLLVDQHYDSYRYLNGHLFRYNANGYPIEIWGYDPADPAALPRGKGLYFYTH